MGFGGGETYFSLTAGQAVEGEAKQSRSAEFVVCRESGGEWVRSGQNRGEHVLPTITRENVTACCGTYHPVRDRGAIVCA
jgi:hypothetical protein